MTMTRCLVFRTEYGGGWILPTQHPRAAALLEIEAWDRPPEDCIPDYDGVPKVGDNEGLFISFDCAALYYDLMLDLPAEWDWVEVSTDPDQHVVAHGVGQPPDPHGHSVLLRQRLEFRTPW